MTRPLPGTLFVVAAPSGAGKSSLVNAVLAREPGIALSISFTSRAPRPGERHAQHYHFVDKAEFEGMVAAGDFFEHALVPTHRNSSLRLFRRISTTSASVMDGPPAQVFVNCRGICRPSGNCQ
jgi:guanylate kinase